MTPQALYHTLVAMFSGDKREASILVLGPPGIGKTAIPAQAAEKAGLGLPLTFPLPTCESVDLRGLPYRENGQTKWASPMPREGRGVVIFDELTSAAPDVQVAAHHLLWDEAGSDMGLPAGWHIIATGNEAKHKTLYHTMSAPLRNRLTILKLEPDVDQWTKWAMDNGISSDVVGFIRWRPTALVAKDIPQDGAFESPRSWSAVSNILKMTLTGEAEREMLAGTVGEGQATEFSAFLKMRRGLPDIQEIVANPKKAKLPKEPSLLYALVTNLAQYTRAEQESVMEYVTRMPAEFALLYILDIRDHFDLYADPEIKVWVGNHKLLFKDAVS